LEEQLLKLGLKGMLSGIGSCLSLALERLQLERVKVLVGVDVGVIIMDEVGH
jgi:hypothetical protein